MLCVGRSRPRSRRVRILLCNTVRPASLDRLVCASRACVPARLVPSEPSLPTLAHHRGLDQTACANGRSAGPASSLLSINILRSRSVCREHFTMSKVVVSSLMKNDTHRNAPLVKSLSSFTGSERETQRVMKSQHGSEMSVVPRHSPGRPPCA